MAHASTITTVVCTFLIATSVCGLKYGKYKGNQQCRVKEATRLRFEAFGGKIQQVVNKVTLDSRRASVSGECMAQIVTWSESLANGTEWAARMLDAWGQRDSGYLDGDSIWEGSWPACSRVNDITTGIRGRHCLTEWPGVQRVDGYGTCLPATCSESDVKQFLIDSVDFLEMSMPPLWRDLGMENAKTFCVIPTTEKGMTKDASAMAAIAVLSFFGLLAVIGTIYDVATMGKNTPNKTTEEVSATKANGNLDTGTVNENGGPNSVLNEGRENAAYGYHQDDLDPHTQGQYPPPDYMDRNDVVITRWEEPLSVTHQSGVKPKPWQPGTFGKICLAFSIRQHVPKMLSFDHPKGSIKCINGVRFLSFAWIVLIHGWTLGVPPARSAAQLVANKFIALDVSERPTALAVKNGAVGVEAFFVLSGFLTTIMFLKKLEKKTPDCEMMGRYFFHRYWRLTPVYMLLVMFYGCLFNYLASGPFYRGEDLNTDASNCKPHFWKHLIYVNNLVDIKPETECMGWSWYLANDFQFHVIAPVFLFPLFYLPTFGIVLTVLGVCGGLIANIYIIHLSYVAKNPDGSAMANGFFDWYIKPWTRCTSYLMAVVMGHFLWKRNFKVKMNKGGVAVGWILFIVLSAVVVYVNYDTQCKGCDRWPDRGTAAYESLKNTALGSVVCWVVFACSTGHGGFINSILSWNGWLPFARLSYAGYLFHPILCLFFQYQRPVQYYYNDMDQVFYFVGFLFLSLGASFVISLVLEVPFMSLERLMFENTPGSRAPRDTSRDKPPVSHIRKSAVKPGQD